MVEEFMKTLVVIFVVTLFSVQTVFAGGDFLVRPPANDSCGEWVKSDNRWEKVSKMTWVLGFLSAYNGYNKSNQINFPDDASLELWFDNYCKSNPLKSIDRGTFLLVRELGGRPPIDLEGK